MKGLATTVVGRVRLTKESEGLKKCIGRPVSVFGADTEEGSTLYGPKDCFIGPAPLSRQ